MVGGVGNASTVVAGAVTVLLVGSGIFVAAWVLLNWLLKVTVYVLVTVVSDGDGVIELVQAITAMAAVKSIKIEIIFTGILMFPPKQNVFSRKKSYL